MKIYSSFPMVAAGMGKASLTVFEAAFVLKLLWLEKTDFRVKNNLFYIGLS